MSGLMVSLAVVVAAILAVLVLVFSDQPATEQVRRLRGGRRPQPLGSPGSGPAGAQTGAPVIRRGPPPAWVLQHQLALPSTRPRALAPAGGPGPVAGAGRAGGAPARAAEMLETAEAVEEAEEAEVQFDRGLSFWTRLRSSIALVVLLTAVGTVMALAIGIALFLAGLALRHTLR